MNINKKVEEMINLNATIIEITPELYKELSKETLDLIKLKNIKVDITDNVKTVCMYKQNIDCFAYVKNDKYNGCFCLDELYCRKGNCRFFQERKKAREKYLKNYSIETASTISKNIDKYFREL